MEVCSDVRFPACVVLFLGLMFPSLAGAQTATLRGRVLDPTGAAIPGAQIALAHDSQTQQTTSGAEGRYTFRSLAPGSYLLSATAQGFAPLTVSVVTLTSGQAKDLDLQLVIAADQQQVTVSDESQTVSINPDQNTSAIVLRGNDLDALSDDPSELQNELQALAGPAAGPNGGQIYVDGFEGGQIPPKSSILEVRVNQNPFSAEYDRIGYGRIEIITKPGSAKFKGQISSFATDSALNTSNPLLTTQPSYYMAGESGNVSGPVTKTSSYFFNLFHLDRQNQNIVDALNPTTLAGYLTQAFPSPVEIIDVNPRFDFQLTKNNSISIRDDFTHVTQSGLGVGSLSTADQSSSATNDNNDLQIGDTWIVGPHLLFEPRFEWRRSRNDQSPALFTPSVTVLGAFTNGGASSGIIQDHQDAFVLQNYGTATFGSQVLRFGARARLLRDASLSESGINGSYFFSSVANYQAQTPQQYSATVIANPLARVLLFDGSVFVQDDWRVKPNFLLGLGLRYEGQNRIRDHADLGPRLAFAWSPGRTNGKTPPKTVIRAGYGWFFTRFTVPSSFNGGGQPYILQTIHDNLINQKSYVVTNPGFFNPAAAESASTLATYASSIPTYHTVDSHFHAALDMQGGIGVDRQLTKKIMANVTYLYTQGIHQYFTDNITAPDFDESTYTFSGAPPTLYNYQFQSGGFYRQHQVITTVNIRFKKMTVSGNYTFSNAKSDTQGVNSFPSDAHDPGFDFGRAGFGIAHRVLLVDSYSAPHGFVLASLLSAQSGTPYNLTIGQDLTGNNQFNARPTFGTCGAAGVISTEYGCLDTDPIGKNEPIVPFGLGTGPANFVMHIRASKVIGIGPHLKTEGEGQSFNPNGGGVGGRGLSGGGASVRLDAAAPRRYNLTFAVGANNVFNVVNRGTPNGVLLSPLFNKTQTLANGPYGSPIPGNRTVFLQSNFSF